MYLDLYLKPTHKADCRHGDVNGEFYQKFRKDIIPTLHKLPQEIEDGTLSNSLMKREFTRKRGPVFLMNIDVKI